MARKFICGAGCNIAAVGTLSGGLEHWSAITGTPTIVTSGPSPMRGDKCFRINPSAGNVALEHTFASAISSPASPAARFYVYIASLNSGSTIQLLQFQGGSAYWGVSVNNTGGNITIGGTNGLSGISGGVLVTTGQWYKIEVKVVFDTTRTADVTVDDVAASQLSTGGFGANTCTSVRIGAAGGGTPTGDVYIADVVVDDSGAVYPNIGHSIVKALYPSADGTHNFNANTDWDYEDTSAVAVGATDTWTHLRNPLSATSTTLFMVASAPTTSEYLRWVMEDLPANADTVKAVAVVSTNFASQATACLTDVLAVDNSATSGTTVASEINHMGGWSAGVFTTGVDVSEVSITVNYSCAATGATTGAWTVANVNDLAIIFGGTDVAPDPQISGVCLEVEYTELAAGRAQVDRWKRQTHGKVPALTSARGRGV